ncbi:MAG TPA: hypothetical protein VFE58_13910 [Tepidisphaeraceae bacterium]|jgi:hypothetical protein|nr:hypothetical protein [Tepidisphaeraceae bacterium]
MKVRAYRSVCAAAIAALSLAGIAQADSVTATLTGVSPAQIVGIHYNGNSLGSAYAGALNWQGVAGNADFTTGSFNTFCIDLTQDVYIGSQYTYSVVTDIANASPVPLPPTAPIGATGMGAVNAQQIENLYSLEYDNIAGNNDRAAAFQIAMWEMLFDTGTSHDVTTGQFSVSGASSNVISLANGFVTEAINSAPMQFHNDILAMVSPTYQDQLYIGGVNTGNGPPGSPVPTPAAAFGAIPLLGGLAAFRRKKHRDAR